MHKIKNISSIAQPQLQAVSEEQNAPDTIKHIDDGENKIKKALLALATASIAALGMVIVFKNKGKIKPAQLADNTLNTLKDINFKNGNAHIKNSNDLFTGTITDKLKNGDLIELAYKDGIIQSSTRKGEKSFEKIYERLNDNKLSSIITYNDAKILSKSVCDDMGKIRFTTNKNGDINYIYDSKGNLSKVFKNNTSIARNFKYDADNRLTSYIKKGGFKISKTYDSDGKLAFDYIEGTKRKPKNISRAYNQNGKLLNKTISDKNGTRRLIYDSNGKPSRLDITDSEGNILRSRNVKKS